jgi:hypothetical protein
MIKNTAGQKIGVQMVSATTGAAFTSTVTVYVTGDAGTQALGAVGSGVCTHEGNGYHTYTPSQAETNYDLIAFTFIGTGAIPKTIQVFTAATIPSEWGGGTLPVMSSDGTYTRYKIREEVRRFIRDPEFPKADIDKAINSVISTLNILGRYKFHQGYSTITLVASQKAYSIPSFIAEEVVVYEADTEDQKVLFKAPDIISPYQDGWFSDTDDIPTAYLMWGNQIWFNALPNATAAGKTVRVYGYYRLALLNDDVTVVPLNDAYCISILALGAASEINPNLVIESSGKQSAIGDLYQLNLKSMIKSELWEPAVSHQIMKDPLRWGNLGRIGNIGRIR